MDHTPQHAIYRQEFRDDASFAARTNRPYAAEWDAARRHIYCRAEIDWEHRSAFRFKGSIRDGEVVVTDPAALQRLHFTAKFYVPSVKRWFGVRTTWGLSPLPILERAAVLDETDFARLIAKHREMNAGLQDSDRQETGGMVAPDELEEVIRQHVKKVFLKYAQNLSRASAALKISRNTLRKYVQEC